ncbi:MAG: 6-phosphofructokinase [Anaerolineae bacterium]|nr:6-phosphofructokinase [Anaerolineae bacterium]
MSAKQLKNLAVFTSGGDAQGMNAAVRSVVRTALDHGVTVYAIYEGYQGMVDGGGYIRKMDWDSVGGIMNRGGTVIGSARCQEFRTREGRRKAARNLVEHDIDNLVVIGGDGSLTGANLFRQEWPELLAELAAQGEITPQKVEQHAYLKIVGMVGSIDNDMFGTDMTIGADSALHRIVDAIDAITSTAASHQRTFVVEVMGRRCGYLALMSALATGASWVFIPESPPEQDDWEDEMCRVLEAVREAGRRARIVVVAEGAQDRNGKLITSDYVKQVLETRLGEDTRVTILGHVQRGGSPSAFDRYLTTIMGHAAVEEILSSPPDKEPQLIGIRHNRIIQSPLMDCVKQTHDIAEVIAARDYEKAMEMRGGSFKQAFYILRTLLRAKPHRPEPGKKQMRLAVINSGMLGPGMNTAVRTAVRLGLDRGHTILGIQNGFQGFITGNIAEMNWMSVSGWVSKGGSELGTNRKVPDGSDFYAIARRIEEHDIQGLLMIGGWPGYETVYQLYTKRNEFPAFNIPMICLPATIDNNLPGCELSIGTDTALNNIVEAVDKIKQSAMAARRCFIVEVMGRYCGYLALMSGLATGAERVYLHEEGVTLKDLQTDLVHLIQGFEGGKRLGLMIRNEQANALYTTEFMRALFEEEGGTLFDVRQAILGHLQIGGDPSPFDRIQATQLAARCVDFLIEKIEKNSTDIAGIGLMGGEIKITNLEDWPRLIDEQRQRPKNQWWLELRPIAKIMAQPGPQIQILDV